MKNTDNKTQENENLFSDFLKEREKAENLGGQLKDPKAKPRYPDLNKQTQPGEAKPKSQPDIKPNSEEDGS